MKKIFCTILTLIIIFSCCTTAFAGGEGDIRYQSPEYIDSIYHSGKKYVYILTKDDCPDSNTILQYVEDWASILYCENISSYIYQVRCEDGIPSSLYNDLGGSIELPVVYFGDNNGGVYYEGRQSEETLDSQFCLFYGLIGPSNISVDKTTYNIKIGESITIYPNISPLNAINDYRIYNYNKNVASTKFNLNSGIVVTGLKKGTATITLETLLYSINTSFTINVIDPSTTTYTLTYNANGGSGAPSSQTGATRYTVSSTKPTRSGYTFLGWSKSSSATSASYVAGNTITLSANTTLYAVWSRNSSSNNDNIKVTIRNNPGTRTLNYGDTVRIYADAQNLPAGAKIGWYVDDGSTISAKVSDDGTYCDITATGNGTVTLAAKAVDANGNVMTDSNGYQIADVQKINTKTSLWLRIVSFFKNLFGINRTTVQLFKGLF